MDILFLMIICSVSLAFAFLGVFIYNAKKGQFEDDESPAVRILLDKDENEEKEVNGKKTIKKREKNKFKSD